jgi:regulator of protease activity HflC (stomatin/prohibitin superfamily)
LVQWNQINWMRLVLLVLLLLYWLFARSLERVDGNIILASWFLPDLSVQQAAQLELPLLYRFPVEMLHPRVLRHLIPVVAGWWLAVEAAVSLVQVLYDCPDRKTARDFLRRQRRAGAGLELPLAVTDRTLDQMRQDSLQMRVGGPVSIAIPGGNAAATELNGRFLRVLPAGTHALGRFEYLRAVIDLHPQERSDKAVPLQTKEGITVNADVQVSFRISTGGEPITRTRPYPYSEDAVRRAAYAGVVLANGNASSWHSMPLSRVKGALAEVVSQYRVDELLFPTSPVRQLHFSIRREVERRVRAGLQAQGIDLLRLQISGLTPPEPVTQQYMKYWLTHWQTRDRIVGADSAASAIEEVEVARAEAEITMIQAIVEGVRRAQREGAAGMTGDMLALRLIEALERLVRQSQTPGRSPDQILPRLHDLQRRLASTSRLLESGEKPSESEWPIEKQTPPLL